MPDSTGELLLKNDSSVTMLPKTVVPPDSASQDSGGLSRKKSSFVLLPHVTQKDNNNRFVKMPHDQSAYKTSNYKDFRHARLPKHVNRRSTSELGSVSLHGGDSFAQNATAYDESNF